MKNLNSWCIMEVDGWIAFLVPVVRELGQMVSVKWPERCAVSAFIGSTSLRTAAQIDVYRELQDDQ